MATDRMQSITNAMAKLDAPEPVAAAAPAPTAAPAAAAPATAVSAPDRSRDEGGRFATKPAEPAAPTTATDTKPTTPQPTAPKYKPPASWKPAIREKWSTLPEEVQEEIERTEKAASQRIAKAAEAERGYGAFRQALTPYEAQIRASGKAIPDALGEALAFAHRVRNGTPQERAAAIAEVVTEAEQAGVGLDAINAVLSQGGVQAQPKPAEFRDPRFDQLINHMQSQQRARVSQTIEDFAAKHEFFVDVKDDVAGLMESGIAKDLPSAYDYAIALPKHAELRAILDQRKAAEAAQTAKAATDRAAQAATSVRASPVSGAGPKPTSRRDIIASHM